MSGKADLSASVSTARAIEIATARIAAYEQAIDVLGVSLTEALLRDAKHIWEGARNALLSIQGHADYRQSDDEPALAVLRFRWMELAQDAGPDVGRALGGREVFAMLAREWPDYANEHVQEAHRMGLRS